MVVAVAGPQPRLRSGRQPGRLPAGLASAGPGEPGVGPSPGRIQRGFLTAPSLQPILCASFSCVSVQMADGPDQTSAPLCRS